MPKQCPFTGLACTILRGPNRGCAGTVIHYDRGLNEFTIRIEYSPDRVVWLWEPRHNTTLLRALNAASPQHLDEYTATRYWGEVKRLDKRYYKAKK